MDSTDAADDATGESICRRTLARIVIAKRLVPITIGIEKHGLRRAARRNRASEADHGRQEEIEERTEDMFVIEIGHF
jgi:hypothetical protein